MRRWLLVALSVLTIGALAVTLWVRPTATPARSTAIPLGTATVVRADIVSHQRLAGMLGYGPTWPVLAPTGDPPSAGERLAGVVTQAPAIGSIVSRGEVLYRVSDHPAVLLYGTEPDWRRLAVGVSGPDVKQLEVNLLALGFADPTVLQADGVFTAADAAAVIRFQAALGVAQSGVLLAGEVIFEPGPVRVTAVVALRGSALSPGAPVLQVTGTGHLVTLALDASKQATVRVGDAVGVLMPDGVTTVTGHVSSISKVANVLPTGNQGGAPASATVDSTIMLDDETKAGTLDQASVYVSITTASRLAVLAVPVTSLLAQPGGGYGVAILSRGPRRVVVVSPGLFGDGGLVEVSGGGLAPGDTIEVPSR